MALILPTPKSQLDFLVDGPPKTHWYLRPTESVIGSHHITRANPLACSLMHCFIEQRPNFYRLQQTSRKVGPG